MLLLLPVVMCMVLGEVDIEQFTRDTNIFAVERKSIIRCAISCLSRDLCHSFSILTWKAVCEPSTQNCGQPKKGEVCYKRRISTGNGKTENFQNETTSNTQSKKVNSEIQTKDDSANKEEIDYVLFLPQKLEGNSLRLKNLNTDEVTSHSGPIYQKVMSVAFMSLSKTLLLCIDEPYQITAFSVDGKKKQALRKAEALSLAADEKSNLIFFCLDVDIEGDGKVLSMTTQGEDVKMVRRTSNKAYCILTDVENHTLYIAYEESIVAVNYMASTEKTITYDKDIKTITLDRENQILYYSQRFNLFRITLPTNTTKKMINMWNYPTAIKQYKDRIFVASDGTVNFQVVKHVFSRRTPMAFVKVNKIGLHPLICIVRW